jgi:hypothetical protein
MIGAGGVGGAKSYDREKAWPGPSINHSILSDENLLYGNPLYVLIKETDYIPTVYVLFSLCTYSNAN